ncbi:MAG: transcription-repair coupling factor [Schleiferiaceae bacterium]|nr:transcription-repair coupling factor [Schleiferiaceae bacterium]
MRSHLGKPGNTLVQADKLVGSMLSVFVATLYQQLQRTQVVILDDKEAAAYALNDLEQLIGKKDVLFFPASYRRPYEIEETDNANVLLRTEVLSRMASRKRPPILVTYTDALFEKVVRKKEFTSQSLVVRTGDAIGMDFLSETLFEYKFERVDFVTEPGEFSIRGGIVDVFSFASDQPYRIEFFDDDVDSIRKFDVATQLSTEPVKKAEIVPNLEDKAVLLQREPFFTFIPSDSILWVKQPDLAVERLNDFYKKATTAFEKLSTTIKRASPEALFVDGHAFLGALNAFPVVRTGGGALPDVTIQFGGKPQPAFQKNFDLLADTLVNNEASGYKNIILFGSKPQSDRLHAIFDDQGKKVTFDQLFATLHEGFEDPIANLVVYTDHQIFERYQRFTIKNGFERKQAITLKELNALQYGDFVTHIDHGVGTFGGLQKIEVNGKIQEAIKLVYRDQDVLYISIHSLHKISKFNSKDGTAPVIHKLGSPAWQNLKNKTKKKVKEIAFDLIQLYAKRKEAIGHAYAPDSYLQHELEASFMYEDTPDQIKATADVKQDMERDQPMDRLICGDVGFGKTEVAIRAAFKAATDGKQVAVLVPTTILAFQHFKSFSSRLADFPVKVDYVNRFKKPADLKRTLAEVAEGKIDILIGTHRIVSKDVNFKDLGLLIIDEEQKFGVSVKDKIKTFRVNIDTLTLTATPIPRTLQFSLMAARDLSVMNTPPPNRQPIETQIIGFQEEIIRDSISYEIQRGGQVFFINNRVQNIKEVAGMIQRLVPDARVGIGHGQMTGKELEDTMLNFMEGRYDVLVATTIIESGLDVPNANTIIINNAHQFGLSDLHQMRGRVGRSTKKAFCKLIAPPLSGLPDESRKRLQALEMFSDLGSGFKIALRDLEIRGAGDMLGAEQSGFITDMGFDAYQKILAEAVTELKETEFKSLYAHEQKQGTFAADCQIDTDLPLMIPDDYINNIEERLRLYQELDSFEKVEELEQFKSSLHDRFGALPGQVEELIDSMRLRWTAKTLGIERLILKQETLIAHLVPQSKTHYYESDTFTRVLHFVRDHYRHVKMKQKGDKLTLRVDQVKTVKQAIQLLEPLLDNVVEQEKIPHS